MKNLNIILAALLIVLFACEKDKSEPTPAGPGTMEIEFDNVAIINNVVQQLKLAEAGSTDYPYTNAMGQPFNITFLRYFISEIVLEGPNGEYYADKMSVSATASEGYYLIDEANFESQIITLKDIPAGEYNKVSFTVGVEENGVVEGAAGGALDPATNKMFWNWNSGYVAVKFEGQSPVSAGGASGNSITSDNAAGVVFHVGGWKEQAGTAFVNNNKSLSYTFDTKARISADDEPHVHMYFDVLSLFGAKNKIDFTGNVNVHKPVDGTPIAENFEGTIRYDHIHQ